ncbi:MAG: class I SAM-dependent methyltransferase [Bacilli bacterium]|nr:class I SAM-dependent methyltransferase [Bacilli bacterium]
MNIAKDWQDYEIIEMNNGEKVERWGDYILRRPDPQIIWKTHFSNIKYDAIYHRSNTGGGYWEKLSNIEDRWQIKYKDLTFNIKLMSFKHTGIFPEQAVNWDYMIDKIKRANRPIKVLNLFAYTGGASVACLYAGASVCHVDSSKGMVEWAKENVLSSSLEDKEIRYIVDDVTKFVEREIRRGSKYDAIIMDPPSFGRGINGEVWKLEDNLFDLVKLCSEVLSDNPLFFLINSYTTGISSKVLENILYTTIKNKGIVTSGEIALPMKNSNIILPCGIYGKWENDEDKSII